MKKILQKLKLKEPILKSKMTKLGMALLTISQSPSIFNNEEHTKIPPEVMTLLEPYLHYLAIASSLLVIWGGLRKTFNYFGK